MSRSGTGYCEQEGKEEMLKGERISSFMRSTGSLRMPTLMVNARMTLKCRRVRRKESAGIDVLAIYDLKDLHEMICCRSIRSMHTSSSAGSGDEGSRMMGFFVSMT